MTIPQIGSGLTTDAGADAAGTSDVGAGRGVDARKAQAFRGPGPSCVEGSLRSALVRSYAATVTNPRMYPL